MLTPIEQLESQINGVDRSLAYHTVLQLMETNRLLRLLIEGKPVAETIDEPLKRPELMKRMGKIQAPKGWQKWSNDKMIEYLKGESK